VRARLGTDNIQPRQFEATSSLIAPEGTAWFAIADTQVLPPEVAAWLKDVPATTGHTLADYPPYRLYHVDLAQRVAQAAQQAEQTMLSARLPVKFGDAAELQSYQLLRTDQDLTLITFWRAIDRSATPLKIFIHVLGPDGSIAAQDDRLDAPADLWQRGDWIVQFNHVTVPPAAPPAAPPVTIAIGLYNPETGTRLPINLNGATADRLLLKSIDLK